MESVDTCLRLRLLACLLIIIQGVATAVATSRIIEISRLDNSDPTFVDGRVGWCIGREHPTLWKTTDGGLTWTEVKIRLGTGDVRFEFDGVHFISAKTVFLGLRAPGDRHLSGTRTMVSTHDGGGTWQAETLPNESWYLESLAASDNPAGPVWLGGQKPLATQADPKKMDCPRPVEGFALTPAIYYRARAKSAWEAQRLPVHDGCPVSILQFVDDMHGVAIAGNAVMFSRNSGKDWQMSTVVGSLPIVRPVTLQLEGADGWIGSEDGAIWKTDDGGQHWHELAGSRAIKGVAMGFGRWGATHFVSTDVGFTLRGNEDVFETHDGGKTWTPILIPEMVHDLVCAASQCWLVGVDKIYRIERSDSH